MTNGLSKARAPMTLPHFIRHSPSDVSALDRQIEHERTKLDEAMSNNNVLLTVDHAGNLGAMLTSARREPEGYEVLRVHLDEARGILHEEPSAWLIHALATAAQYLGRYVEANELFEEALQLAQQQGWRKLEHFVLFHWGRCLAEQSRFSESRSCFERSLNGRIALGDPLQESSRRALVELERLEKSLR